MDNRNRLIAALCLLVGFAAIVWFAYPWPKVQPPAVPFYQRDDGDMSHYKAGAIDEIEYPDVDDPPAAR